MTSAAPDGVVAVPRVSAVIVNYETSALAARCVASLGAQGVSHEIIVVDNPSAAGDAANLDGLGVRVVRNVENVGYGRGCNAGAEAARGELICVLNPDTVVPPGALDAWVAAFDRMTAAGRRIGCLAPRLLNDNGAPQRSAYNFVGPLNYWAYHSLAAGAVKKLRKAVRVAPAATTRTDATADPSAGAQRVDWVMGAALLIPRAAWDAIGGFGSNYFMYAEDEDLCLRLGRAGWEVVFAPGVRIGHSQGEPSAESRDRAVARFYDGLRIFLHQHYRPARRRAVQVCVVADMAVRVVIFGVLSTLKPGNLLNANRLRGYRGVLALYARDLAGLEKPPG